MLKKGDLLNNRFRLLNLLGRGAFTETWLAMEIVSGGMVVLKVFFLNDIIDGDRKEIVTQKLEKLFLRLENLHHCNIVNIHTFGFSFPYLFMVMPYIEGRTVEKLIGKDAVTEEQCWHFLHDVAAGLTYLHEQKPPICHQNIKLGNIFLNECGTYLIADIEIKELREIIATYKAKQAGETFIQFGTIAYAAPECYQNNYRPIPASDIWSLGTVLYELMTGYLPSGNPSRPQHEMQIIKGDYSQELKDIVCSCLAAEPMYRPTAKRIMEMSENYLDGLVSSNVNNVITSVY